MIGWVYLVWDAAGGRCKIGRTTGSDRRRQRVVMQSYPTRTINLVNVLVDDCAAVESQCHRRYSAQRLNGEWFAADAVEIAEYLLCAIPWHQVECASHGEIVLNLAAARRGDSPPLAGCIPRALRSSYGR